MTDDEFLNYCRTHADTQRCGFVPEHIARLIRLAGGKEEDAVMWDETRNTVFNLDRFWVIEQVEAARKRKSDHIALADKLIAQARKEWIEHNVSQSDVEEGRDIVTPYDVWFYRERTT